MTLVKNGVSYQVLELNVSVGLNTACTVFGSCSKVPEAATISSNAQGFLQFQADSSLEKALVDLTFNFEGESKNGTLNLDFDALTCNSQPENNEVWGYTNITKCQCKVCTESCNSAGMKVVFPTFFNGFNYKLVGISYGVIIVVGLLLFALSKCIENMRKKSTQTSVKEELQYIAPRKDSE